MPMTRQRCMTSRLWCFHHVLRSVQVNEAQVQRSPFRRQGPLCFEKSCLLSPAVMSAGKPINCGPLFRLPIYRLPCYLSEYCR